MKIQKIEIGEVTLPLVTPFKTALRTVNSVNDIIVRITADNGEAGFGEAPPTAVITGDTLASIRNAIENHIAPAIEGMDVTDIDGIMSAMHSSIKGNSSAKAAVDMAVYDLFAKQCRLPLYKLLGGQTNTIETDLTISANPIGKMVADSLSAVENGFKILKIKVGKSPENDIAAIEEIRRAVPSEIRLRLDANQGWSAKQAVKIITSLEDRGVLFDLVEQPLPAHDLAGMQYVTANIGSPVLADESVFSAADAIELIHRRAADCINIKLMKTGGIYEALKICAVAEIYNVQCMIGCMLESKVSVSAAAHLAGGKSIISMADLDGPSLCAEDPYSGGPLFKGGSIFLSDAPGIGITSAPCFKD